MKPIFAAIVVTLVSGLAANAESWRVRHHCKELKEEQAWLAAHPNEDGIRARSHRSELKEEEAWLAKNGGCDSCSAPAKAECDEECKIPAKPCGHFQEVEVTRTLKGYYTTEYDVQRTPGYYVSHDEQELVCAERCEKIPVPPQFKTEIDCTGKEIRIMTVCPSFREEKHAAVYRTKCVKTYVKGTCKVVARQVWHEGSCSTKCERIWVKD